MDKNIKIYDLDYLVNNELTEEDLHYIFDTKSLHYSLIIELHKMMHIKKTNEEIITSFKNWDEVNYKWNNKQQKHFYDKLEQAYKNIYQVNNVTASFKSDWWCYLYGPRVNK